MKSFSDTAAESILGYADVIKTPRVLLLNVARLLSAIHLDTIAGLQLQGAALAAGGRPDQRLGFFDRYFGKPTAPIAHLEEIRGLISQTTGSIETVLINAGDDRAAAIREAEAGKLKADYMKADGVEILNLAYTAISAEVRAISARAVRSSAGPEGKARLARLQFLENVIASEMRDLGFEMAIGGDAAEIVRLLQDRGDAVGTLAEIDGKPSHTKRDVAMRKAAGAMIEKIDAELAPHRVPAVRLAA
jgi:hypothetical protein